MGIRVVIAGPRGKMGSQVINMMKANPKFHVVAYLDHQPTKFTEKPTNIPIFSDAKTCFTQVNAQVLIDFTVAEASFKYIKLAMEQGIRVVSGTTGFSDEQIKELAQLANKLQIGCVIAPNFALGAVLMMEFAKQAAKYFPHVEIIDKHHEQKLDAPSGTAIKTAQLIQQTRKAMKQGHPKEAETIACARGAQIDGMNIHSFRLPGYVAHHEVIFGGSSQTLSIKHDSIHRESFMDGLKLALDQVMDLKALVYGLENILDR